MKHPTVYYDYKDDYKDVAVKRARRLLDNIEKHVIVKTVYSGTEDEIRNFYEKIADQMGTLVPMDENLATGNKTGNRWIDILYDRGIKDSYRHSNVRQPLHTDGAYEAQAPDVAFLFALKSALVGGYTTFIESDELVTLISIADPELLLLLENHPIKFSKGNDSKTSPIIRRQDGKTRLTWNYFRVDEDNTAVAHDISARFHSFLETIVTQSGSLTQIKLEPGQAVYFDDERVLHGRTSFIGERHLVKGGIRLERS